MSFARVQGHHGTDTGTSGTFAVAGSAVASGNAVMGIVTVGSPNVTDILSVTDNQGNTYTITDKLSDTTNNQATAYFFCLNTTNAPTTITLHYSAGLSAVLLLWDEISGLGAGTLNGHHARVQPGASVGANTVSTGATFGASGDFIYGATLCDDSVNTVSAGTSPLAFTTATNDNADANFFGVSLFTEFATAAAASDVTFGINASGTMLTGGFAITPAGGGTGRAIAAAATIAAFTSSAALTVTSHLSAAATIAPLTAAAALKVAVKLAAAATIGAFASAAAFSNGSGVKTITDWLVTQSGRRGRR